MKPTPDGLAGLAAREAVTDALAYTLSMLRRSAEREQTWHVYPAEARALIAEVDRLRIEVDLLQQEARIRRAICDGFVADLETACNDVEARIVAWLRQRRLDTREYDGSDNAVSLTLAVTADRIERGEHREEAR